MRTLPVLVALVLLAPALAEGASPSLPTALFGMSWGDPLPAGMVKLEVKVPPGYAMYARPADQLELAGVPVRAVHYVFQNGRLEGLTVALDPAQKEALTAALTRSWGPAAPRGTTGDVVWNTPTLRAILGPIPDNYVLRVSPR